MSTFKIGDRARHIPGMTSSYRITVESRKLPMTVTGLRADTIQLQVNDGINSGEKFWVNPRYFESLDRGAPKTDKQTITLLNKLVKKELSSKVFFLASGAYELDFHKTGIKVGCQFISKAEAQAIARKIFREYGE